MGYNSFYGLPTQENLKFFCQVGLAFITAVAIGLTAADKLEVMMLNHHLEQIEKR